LLAAHGLVAITDEAEVLPTGKMARGKAAILAASEEVKLCVGKAKMIGTWLGQAGETVTVMQMWGIRP